MVQSLSRLVGRGIVYEYLELSEVLSILVKLSVSHRTVTDHESPNPTVVLLYTVANQEASSKSSLARSAGKSALIMGEWAQVESAHFL
jgi:hypothetical protein